ncbi:enoyl-CoA hydratase-related protein [Thalassiella azotivora]
MTSNDTTTTPAPGAVGSGTATEQLAGGALLLRRHEGRHEGWVEVVLNRPERLNAFTDAVYDGLLQVCDRVRDDESVRVVGFRGAGGRAFAAGNDIGELSAIRTGRDGVAHELRVRGVLEAVGALPQVTVAVVEGACVGGGLALATYCDLRLAARGARFGYPIARTLGNALSSPVLARCAAVFGESLTRQMLLAARLVDADRAHAVGALVDVADPEGLDDAVRALVADVLRCSTTTQRVTKEQLHALSAGCEGPVPGDEALLSRAYGGQDFAEGLRAFAARERPRFGGPDAPLVTDG